METVAASQSKSIGMDAIFQYTGSGVQFFSGMIFYLIIVRLFSSSAVGAIALFIAIIGLFSIIFSFGLGTAAQHFTAYNIGKGDFPSAARTFYKIIGIGFGVSILGFLTLFTLSPLISEIFLHSEAYINLVRLLSTVLLGIILFGILNGTLLGLQNFRLSAILNIAIWIVYYFCGIFLALYIRDLNVIILGWALGVFLGVLLELVVILRLLSRFKGTGDIIGNQTLLKYSLPIVMSGLIGYGAVYADRFVVAGLMNLSSLGVYNFALLIASSIGFFAIPFNNILMPKFSELFGRGEKKTIASLVRASSMLLSSVYVPAAVGISAMSPLIIDLLAGKNYSGSAFPLTIIMIASALFISNNILTQAVASVRRTNIFIYSSIGSFGANLILSYALIPIYGLIGAAIGFSSVYAATFVILSYHGIKENLISFDIIGHFKIWVASLIMFALVTYFIHLFGEELILIPLYILIGSICYLLLVRVLHMFGQENKELLLSMFPPSYVKIRKTISLIILH